MGKLSQPLLEVSLKAVSDGLAVEKKAGGRAKDAWRVSPCSSCVFSSSSCLLPQPMQPHACCWFCPCSGLLWIWFPLSEGHRHCKLTKTQTELVLPNMELFSLAPGINQRGGGAGGRERERERGVNTGLWTVYFFASCNMLPSQGIT